MKKIVAVLVLAFCLNNNAHAQTDTNKGMDTSRLGSKQGKMDRTNQDSTNSKKKMPQKSMSADTAMAPHKMSPGMKGKSSTPKNR